MELLHNSKKSTDSILQALKKYSSGDPVPMKKLNCGLKTRHQKGFFKNMEIRNSNSKEMLIILYKFFLVQLFFKWSQFKILNIVLACIDV